ncbi:hypothetical protein AB0N16_18675 [Streptomyces sp. NPDC051105]|uniref:hypothetical protein n=1 Tax=Streptomyces sp. NPDC051105 TaxID=3154843 RepID=UPI00341DD4CD
MRIERTHTSSTYARLGWSVRFGTGLTTAAPGSAQNMYLCVPDIVATRDRLNALGVEVGDYYHTGGPAPRSGLHLERESYRSHFPFHDPDGPVVRRVPHE